MRGNALNETPKKREKSIFREYFELIVETAVFVFFVMTFVVQAFQIPSGSMEPTLLVGDFLLVNKLAYVRPVLPLEGAILPRKDLARKDIVVFKYPNELKKDYVKRIIGLPGETIEIRNKEVLIDGKPIEEKYKVHGDSQRYSGEGVYSYDNLIRGNYGPVRIPAGQCFVMGDNRDNSEDSRVWGFLPLDNIKGRPWVIYFSYRAERDAYQKTSLGDRLRKFVSFLTKARFSRILRVVR